jgi:hypothetical protein
MTVQRIDFSAQTASMPGEQLRRNACLIAANKQLLRIQVIEEIRGWISI